MRAYVALASGLFAAAALGVGCRVDLPEFVPGDEPDGSVPPDAITCEPNAEVCDDDSGVYVSCNESGDVDVSMTCPLGCADEVEKCLDVDPSNGLGEYLDMTASAASMTVGGFDTDSGACLDALGTSVTCSSVVLDDITVFVFDTVTVGCTGCPVPVTGSNALAIVADGDVTILGTLDVSANGAANGPGGVQMGTPGAVSPDRGQGGAGHVVVGADGGDTSDAESGGAGGPAYNQIEDLQPLVGGSAGAGILGKLVALGGGGGGAVQLTTRGRIVLMADGRIDASGGGGQPGDTSDAGGGGGGSGGSILLEAREVVLDGAGVVISTKGGGGGAAGQVGAGADGGVDAAPAGGGTGVDQASGGAGGSFEAKLVFPIAGAAGLGPSKGGGGGGGSVGWTRLNTRVEGDVSVINGAALRTARSFSELATRLVP